MASSGRDDRILARRDAREHARAMLASLQQREGIDLSELRRDPIGWLGQWGEIEVFDLTRTPHEASERCDVDGLYLAETEPPGIGLAFSATPERMNFTALHELGHHIQLTDGALVDALFARPDGGKALEEEACDAFAAAILIPEEAAAAALGQGIPTAESVARLWADIGSASRAAIAVRAARDLPGDAHVVVLSGSGEVTFAASTAQFRPGRRSDQTRTPIWAAIERAPQGRPAVAEGQFAYGGELAGDRYYMQAARAGGSYFLVAAIERVPWQFSVARRDQVEYGRAYTCPHPMCGSDFRAPASTACSTCGSPDCPTCGRCGCKLEAPGEFLCTECFMVRPAWEASERSAVCSECV